MSGSIFTISSEANQVFGHAPTSFGLAPTGQQPYTSGAGQMVYIELESGAGNIELESTSGVIELEAGP